MYGYDVSRSSINNEKVLSPSNIGRLSKLWSFKTQDVIAAPATVVGYTVYIGSWDGYEYAIDSQTGALNWKTFLGKTVAHPWCSPPKLGVSSGATYDNGVLYIGGGDSYWYALDARTGNILWKIFTGDNSATGGYYNWASPLIYKGYAYVGIASEGDCPLVPGKLLKVSLSEHKVVQSINLVPDKQVGAGVWSSPTLDVVGNTLYLSTGTRNNLDQINSQALLGVDLNTFTVVEKDRWRLPIQDEIIDSDFGGTPALFKASDGTRMLICVNKNGIAYAFKAGDLSAGPVWQDTIAETGLAPTNGAGSISTAVFANNTVYIAGGNSVINNVGYQGSVRALNPDNGKEIWVHKSTGPILGALTYSNGMIFANAGNVLEVLNARDGTRLASYTFDGQIYDAPVVSHGQVILGDTTGSIYALGLPTLVQSTKAGKKCENLTCWDVANPSHAATNTLSNGIWKITAGGNGINIRLDQLNFAAQNVSGDTQISVKLASLDGSNPLAQAGLMIRQSADPGSPFYGVFVNKKRQLVLLYREMLNGPIGSLGMSQGSTLPPLYLQIQRVDDQFVAATSKDGVHYAAVPGSAFTLPLTTKALAGLVTSAGDDQSTATAIYQNLAFAAPTVVPALAPSSTPCITGWNCGSVGYPAVTGTQKLNGQTFTIAGGGTDIGAYADQFHFVWREMVRDGAISAHLVSQTPTTPSAKAGLMIRQGQDAGAPFYAVLFTPKDGLLLAYRQGRGLVASLSTVVPSAGGIPPYLKIARAGNIFSAYTSTDGVNWTFVMSTNVEMDLSGPMQVGMAVTSNDWQKLGATAFDSVQMADQAPPPEVLCPATWMCHDVNFDNDVGYDGLLPGTQVYKNGTWTLRGRGEDIGHTADSFHAVWQTLTGSGNVSARLTAIDHVGDYSKAGVMLREGQDAGSRFYSILATPQKGLVVAYRDRQGGNAASIDIILNTNPYLPIYLRVVRAGNVFNPYYSQDGVNWTQVSGTTKTIDMSEKLFAGLAMTSHSQTVAGTATFDSVYVGP
jgi:outer membrane protein assembly factor BamB